MRLDTTVHTTTVADADHENNDLVNHHFVDDPVGTNAEPPEPPQASLEKRTCERLLAKTVDGMDEAASCRLRHAGQLFGCATLDPDGVAHV